MLILLPSLLFGAMFPGYDFTFSETVSSDSLMSLEGDVLGLDYTGYGYIGGESRTGIYLRLGIQAPYSSIVDIFSIEDPLLDPEKAAENLERSFTISIGAGPAFRKFIGDAAIWYMGMGAAFSMDYTNRQAMHADMQNTYLDMDFGADLDMGIRIDVEDTTTLRIGVHGIFTFFSIRAAISSPRSMEGERVTEAEMIPHIFLPHGERKPLQAEGYISLGHTFRKDWGAEPMRYVITSPEPFTGTLGPQESTRS